MTYSHSFLVQATQAGVARFHTEASSLGAITPPLMPMRLHYAPERMADGGEMAFTMWLGPIPVRWVARVEDVTGSGFADRQQSGPFESWVHRHTFVAEDERMTKVVDEVEAKLKRHPLWGPVGLAMWLGLPLLFAYRGWKTKQLLESQPPSDTASNYPTRNRGE
jgi:ligand-binding SRPBCC domain-containing protein